MLLISLQNRYLRVEIFWKIEVCKRQQIWNWVQFFWFYQNSAWCIKDTKNRLWSSYLRYNMHDLTYNEDMFLISQFLGCQIILKNQKKKFLNCFLDVEEYFQKLRFKSKFSFMDPRYEKNDFFWVFWLNIYYGNKPKKIVVYSMPKRTIFLCWLPKKSIYIYRRLIQYKMVCIFCFVCYKKKFLTFSGSKDYIRQYWYNSCNHCNFCLIT